MQVIDIALGAISINPRHRKVHCGSVKSLSSSILEVGLQHPISVRKIEHGYRLIHGRHRLEAYRDLGMTHIEAIVRDVDDLRAEIAEIDENLYHNDLTELEKADALKRRKEIYEELHPETKKGQSQAAGSNAAQGKNTSRNDISATSFADDAAEKLGKTPRSVRGDIAIAENLTDLTKGQIHGTKVADNKAELKRLADMPQEQQEKVAVVLGQGKAKTVAEAKKLAKVKESEKKAIKDAKGKTVPEKITEQWTAAMGFESISRELNGITKRVKELCEQKGVGAYLDLAVFEKDVRNLKHALKFARPYVVCRFCGGAGCAPCKKAGWMPETPTTRNAKE